MTHRYHRLSILCVCGLSVVLFHVIGLNILWQMSMPLFRWTQFASPAVAVQLLPSSSTLVVQPRKPKELRVVVPPNPRPLQKTAMNARASALQVQEKIAIQSEKHDAMPPRLAQEEVQRDTTHWRVQLERMDIHRLANPARNSGQAAQREQGTRVPETEVAKLSKALSKAQYVRCRDAYAAAGLLAIVPLVITTVMQSDDCRW